MLPCTTAVYGAWPTATVWTALVVVSTTLAASARWSATTSFEPSSVVSRPPGNMFTGWPAGLVLGSG